MPLSPTRVPPEEDRFEIRFAMKQGDSVVDCFVDEGAIEDVDEAENDGDPLIERFARHRAMFESIASWLFDEGEETPRIELHHVAQFRSR